MKRTINNVLILVIAIILSLAFSSLDEKGKVHLKVTKEENGEKSVFEKIYNSMDELKADEELKQFDVLVEGWTKEHSKGIIIKKRIDTNPGYTWVFDDDEEIHKGDKHIIIKHKNGVDETIDIKKEKIISIKTDDGEQNFTMKIEGDSDHNIVWIDEDGNKTELTDGDIDQMIKKHDGGKHKEIHKKIEVITSDDEDGEIKVMVIEEDGDPTAQIEVEVKKEIGEDGEEKIIEKKVWVIKDGKKIELDEESDYEFETEGDKIKIKVDDEIMEITDFSGRKFDSDHVMAFHGKSEGNEGIKQTMNINIEEKNGEQFIEINIKRTNNLNLTISDILKDDASLDGIDYSLKSNLKPSQLNYYPNPNNGKFNLKFMLDQKEEVTVKVIDILGKEVYKEKILDFNGTYDNQIDLTGKEKGIYILQIIQKRKALTRKILIE